MLGFGLWSRVKPEASLSLWCYIWSDSRRLTERQSSLIGLDSSLSHYVRRSIQLSLTYTDERAQANWHPAWLRSAPALRWAHVQGRQTEDDAEWHLMGNQWTQTEECLLWHLLGVYGRKEDKNNKKDPEFIKHHKNRMRNHITPCGINSKVIWQC